MSTTVAPSVPYAGYVGTNMVSPGAPFVDGTGALSPVSFRFLYQVFDAINREHLEVYNKFVAVESQLTGLDTRLTTAETNITNNYNAIQTLETQVNGLQTQINTINSRLAAAGIPWLSDSVPVVPVVRRADYTISLEQSHGNTYVHCTVARLTSRIARGLRSDMAAVMALHGGPIFATSHEPHNDDFNKWRKFVVLFGFKFFATATTADGVRHSVYVREG